MTVASDLFLVEGSLGFSRETMAIPVDGILVVRSDQASAISLGAGTLRGIRYTNPAGDPIVLTTSESHTKFFRASAQNTVTFIHNDDDNVTEPTERLLIDSAQNLTLGGGNVHLHFVYAPALAGFRWVVFDPNRLILLGPAAGVAFTNGVALDLWTYTLAEGEVAGVEFKLTAGRETGGVTERSGGHIYFVASRDVGGSAAVTAGAIDNPGTITGGVISVAAVGNTVVVRVTYTTDGTLFYKLRIERDTVNVPQ